MTTLGTRRFRADILEVFEILEKYEGIDEIPFFGFSVLKLEDIQ